MQTWPSSYDIISDIKNIREKLIQITGEQAENIDIFLILNIKKYYIKLWLQIENYLIISLLM